MPWFLPLAKAEPTGRVRWGVVSASSSNRTGFPRCPGRARPSRTSRWRPSGVRPSHARPPPVLPRPSSPRRSLRVVDCARSSSRAADQRRHRRSRSVRGRAALHDRLRQEREARSRARRRGHIAGWWLVALRSVRLHLRRACVGGRAVDQRQGRQVQGHLGGRGLRHRDVRRGRKPSRSRHCVRVERLLSGTSAMTAPESPALGQRWGAPTRAVPRFAAASSASTPAPARFARRRSVCRRARWS